MFAEPSWSGSTLAVPQEDQLGRRKLLIAAASVCGGAVIVAGGIAIYGVVSHGGPVEPAGPGPGDLGLNVPSENNVSLEDEAEGPGTPPEGSKGWNSAIIRPDSVPGT